MSAVPCKRNNLFPVKQMTYQRIFIFLNFKRFCKKREQFYCIWGNVGYVFVIQDVPILGVFQSYRTSMNIIRNVLRENL